MSRPIPCDACRALGCSCDGIAHTCPTCGHVCTMHPSKEPHHASQEDRRLESQRQHPSVVGPILDELSLLEGEAFDRIIAAIEAEDAEAHPCARPDRRGVPRRARRMEAKPVEPYHDQRGPSSLERLALVSCTMLFAAYCTWWLWSQR